MIALKPNQYSLRDLFLVVSQICAALGVFAYYNTFTFLVVETKDGTAWKWVVGHFVLWGLGFVVMNWVARCDPFRRLDKETQLFIHRTISVGLFAFYVISCPPAFIVVFGICYYLQNGHL